MVKRFNPLFLALFLSSVLFICGCETAKGAAKGTVHGVGAVGTGIADGAKKDWAAVMKADDWVKDNMW